MPLSAPVHEEAATVGRQLLPLRSPAELATLLQAELLYPPGTPKRSYKVLEELRTRRRRCAFRARARLAALSSARQRRLEPRASEHDSSRRAALRPRAARHRVRRLRQHSTRTRPGWTLPSADRLLAPRQAVRRAVRHAIQPGRLWRCGTICHLPAAARSCRRARSSSTRAWRSCRGACGVWAWAWGCGV